VHKEDFFIDVVFVTTVVSVYSKLIECFYVYALKLALVILGDALEYGNFPHLPELTVKQKYHITDVDTSDRIQLSPISSFRHKYG
jgi:hypothetical protein